MRTFLLSTLLLCVSPVFVEPAFAGDDALGAAQEMSVADFETAAERLGLSAAQRTQVADLVYASQAAKVDLNAKVEKAELELRHLMVAESLDEKAILKAVDALNAAEGDLRKNKVQLMLSLRKALTADQWKQLVEMRRERRSPRPQPR